MTRAAYGGMRRAAYGGMTRAATLGLAVLALACEREQQPARAPGAAPAPTTPRAALVLEPASLGVGQVADLELAIVTPPGHAPRAYVPPETPPGLWLLEVERLPVAREPTRWVHRTRLRVRANATGGVVFPGGRIEVEAPGAEPYVLAFEPLAIQIDSLIPEYPERLAPFGPRRPDATGAPGGSFWGPAALGAFSAFALVGLVALARHRARSGADALASPAAAAPDAPWQLARSELAAARAQLPERPLAAADATAGALTRYVERRFHGGVAARTTEELAEAEPPFAARSRWPALLEILGGLDALRFPPEGPARERPALAARVAALLAAAEGFVEDSVPPEARR